MRTRLLLPLLPAAAGLALAAPAAAATPAAISQNWAGYEASAQNASGFQAVSGSWREPSVVCTPGQATYSAYWVGLGGGGQGNGSLEQVGTQADCSAAGQASHYAWYELVPSAPVRLRLTIRAGDLIYARTAVNGDRVTVELADKTTGQTATRTLAMRNPDTTTAEWIAEAPSACQGGATGNCQVLPLTDFGTVRFTGAYAGQNGQVSSAGGLGAQSIELSTAAGSAAASSLPSPGTDFSVSYGAGTSTVPAGYGYSGGYGGDPGGYGYSGGSASGGSPGGYSGDYGYGGYSGVYGDPSGYVYVYPGWVY
jgi:hypothetical protein